MTPLHQWSLVWCDHGRAGSADGASLPQPAGAAEEQGWAHAAVDTARLGRQLRTTGEHCEARWWVVLWIPLVSWIWLAIGVVFFYFILVVCDVLRHQKEYTILTCVLRIVRKIRLKKLCHFYGYLKFEIASELTHFKLFYAHFNPAYCFIIKSYLSNILVGTFN